MRSVRFVCAALAALVLLALLEAPAVAKRPLTDAELGAMAMNPELLASACAAGSVSTVDETWAALVASGAEDCDEELLVLAVRDASGSWRRVGWTRAGGLCVDGNAAVPEPVLADLAGCRSSPDRRRPTAEELDAIVREALPRYPAACLSVRVSLRDERWASVVLPDSEECGDGGYVVSRASGAWRVVREVAAFEPVLCRTPGVPEAVMRSLHASCVVPRPAVIACNAGTRSVGRVRPRSCDTSGARTSLATSRWLVGVRWSSWGGARAVGRGHSRHYRSGPRDRHLPVRIELSGLSTRVCSVQQPVYTRLRITYRRSVISIGGTRFRIPAGSTTLRLNRPDDC